MKHENACTCLCACMLICKQQQYIYMYLPPGPPPPPPPPHRMLEAVLIIMCTTTAVSIAVMLLGTCVPVRNDNRANFDPSSGNHLYRPVCYMCVVCHCVYGNPRLITGYRMGGANCEAAK